MAYKTIFTQKDSSLSRMSSPSDTLLMLVRPEPEVLGTLSQVDWDGVVELANEHYLAPLLYARVEAMGLQLPPSAEERLRQRHTDATAHTIFFEFALEGLIDLFRQADIPLVAYKGIPLARMLYGDAALRPGGDIDVMIKATDLERCHNLLRQNGWKHTRSWEIHENYIQELGGTELILEVHWISQREGEYHIPEARFWEEASPGAEGWTFSHEMTLLIIILHCARHFFVPYRQMVDIAHAVAQWNKTLNWARVVALATEANAMPMLATVLALVHRDLGAPLPNHAPLKQQMSSQRIQLTTRYLSTKHLLGSPLFPALDRYLVPILHGNWQPATLILHDLLPPRELIAYRYGISADSWLVPLYRAMRPFELLGKHIRQQFE